jgi:hypothetical protein
MENTVEPRATAVHRTQNSVALALITMSTAAAATQRLENDHCKHFAPTKAAERISLCLSSHVRLLSRHRSERSKH